MRRLSASQPKSWRRSPGFVAVLCTASQTRPLASTPSPVACSSCTLRRPSAAERADRDGGDRGERVERRVEPEQREAVVGDRVRVGVDPSAVARRAAPGTSCRPCGPGWSAASRSIARWPRRGSARRAWGAARLVARAAGQRRRRERRHPDLRLAAPEVACVAVGRDEHRQRVQRLAPGAQHAGRGRRAELRHRLAEHERGERVVGERVLGRVAEDRAADRAAVDQRADGVVDHLRDALVRRRPRPPRAPPPGCRAAPRGRARRCRRR